MLASLPSFWGEWASEFETSAYLSRADSFQFMTGSEDKPVSNAKMCSDRSRKHASILSYPPFDPSVENQGVQIWAGIRWASSDASSTISSRSLDGNPNIGLPSEARLPITLKRAFILFAVSRSGASTILWFFLTLSPYL